MSYCGVFPPFKVVIFGFCLLLQEGWVALRSLGLPGLRARSSGGGAVQGAASVFSAGPQRMWTVNLCWRIRCCRHTWVWKEEPQVFIQTRLATVLPSFGPEECCVMWPFDRRWVFVRSALSLPRRWRAAPPLPGRRGPMEAAAVRDSGETLRPGRRASAAASAHEPSLRRHHRPAGWLLL